MSSWYPATIAASWPEAAQLQAIRLEVAPEVAASHRRAGQFLEVRRAGTEGGAFFAIANAPGRGSIELLVKRGEGLPNELIEAPPGTRLETSRVLGAGYPIEESRGRDILLFATGSGIAPIRAALHEIVRRRSDFGSIELFFGVRTPADLPYREELERLAFHGVRVHTVISQRPPRTGHARYVQERFQAELPPVENAVAFLCGLQGMIDGVREALRRSGMPEERIHLNF